MIPLFFCDLRNDNIVGFILYDKLTFVKNTVLNKIDSSWCASFINYCIQRAKITKFSPACRARAVANERINLKAIQFLNINANWKQEWVIKDFVNCQNLDISGDFVLECLSFSDLDLNGQVETTITISRGWPPQIIRA
jgi:hypothetical protein